MTKFIEVTKRSTREKILININRIESVFKDGEYSIIYLIGESSPLRAEEGFNKIKSLILQ